MKTIKIIYDSRLFLVLTIITSNYFESKIELTAFRMFILRSNNCLWCS